MITAGFTACKEDGERIVINISPAFTSTGLIQVTNYGRCRLTFSADAPVMERDPGNYITDDIVTAIRAVANAHRSMKASMVNVFIHGILNAYDQTVELDHLKDAVARDNDTLSEITAARKQIAQTRLHDAATDSCHVVNAKELALSALDDYIDIVSGTVVNNLARIDHLKTALQ